MHQAAYEFFLRAKGDLFYGFLLLLSAFLAYILRQFASIKLRHQLDGAIGLAIAWIVAGRMVLCSLLLVLVHLLLLRCIKKSSHLTQCSFLGSFAYLALLRTMHFVGFPRLEFVTNAIQLILTLRAIGLSFEVADYRCAKKDENRQQQQQTLIAREPTTFEAFNYLYSFTGLFTGPYYTYRTYSDALVYWQKPLEWTKLKPMIVTKMRTLCWSLPLLVFMTWLDPALRGDRLDSLGGLPRLFLWCALAFVYLRMRIYSAWMVAESICLLAGIGIYPEQGKSEPGQGPKDLAAIEELYWEDPMVEFDAETINNLDIPNVEQSDGFRSGIRAWNRTVQFWLANFVYRRSSKAIRMPYTMLVSAFWHGVHPGYFLSFLTVPLCTAAEDKLFQAFPVETRPKWLQISWSFVRMRGFELMASGFLLLDGWDTLRLWAKMYFWLHFAMLFTIGVVWLWNKRKNRNNEGKQN